MTTTLTAPRSRTHATFGFAAMVAAATNLAAPGRAHAFSEDLVADGTNLANCLSDPGDDTIGVCPPPTNGGRRSMVHVDATYALAMAQGFREDIAYWIAAYSEVTDQGSYTPFGSCNKLLTDVTRKTITNVNGINRTNTQSGGLAFHFMIPFSPTGLLSGLPSTLNGNYPFYPGYPTTIDNVYEGTLSQLRAWAMTPANVTSRLVCTYAFTSSVGASYFSGSACWSPPATIGGQVPLIPLNGQAMTWTAATNAQLLITSPMMIPYNQLTNMLNAGTATGRLWKIGDTGPVPTEVARLGFYLHALQDRISHSYCGDNSYASYNTSGVTFRYNYGATACTNAAHNTTHYNEIGQPTLPLRDFTALNYTYDELGAWKAIMGQQTVHPSWFKSFTPVPKQTLVGTLVSDLGDMSDGDEIYSLGSVTSALTSTTALTRVSMMNTVVAALPAQPQLMPGYNVGDCP